MISASKRFQTAFADREEDDSFPLAPAAVEAGSTGTVTSAAKPVATIPQLADYLVNGFWQYNNTIAHHFGSSTITYNVNGLNANEQMLAQSALNAWHEVANLTFVQTTGAADITFTHNGTMTAYASSYYNGSGIISSATINISADWITNNGGAYDGRTGIDSYGYQTYIHEIGHALGLGHQGPYNGSATYSANAIYADDTWQYSVMSYFSQPNYGGSYRYVITPQMADIYAIQAIYGAATTRTGDTVYGFNNTAGSIFSFSSYSQAPALTIYDSGGNDTLNCSGYSTAQTIDLRAGAFSSVGGLTYNIGIALNASIENAIGGSGNDTLIANDSSCTLTGGGGNDTIIGGAGIDRLFGGTGVDTLSGGGGADSFVFVFGDSSAASGQHDRINGFIAGVDRIDLSGIDAVVASGSYDLFRFIGTSAFSGAAGELNYFYNSSLAVTVVQGDTNGDRVADFAIDLAGNVILSSSDFIGATVTPPVIIEAFGSTSLVQVGGSYYLSSNSSGSGPALKYGGAAVAPGQYGTWAPIGAEQTATGYQVAWKNTGADQYNIWTTDNSGNETSFTSVTSGTSNALKFAETSFQQDLNGSGVIGMPSAPDAVIESSGSTSLVQVGNIFYLNSNSSGSGPALKYGGAAVVPGQYGEWAPIGAEQTATGYQVAWKNTGADQYNIWTTDNSGNETSFTPVTSGSSTALKSAETGFQQDLNGDGVIGIPTASGTVIESFGSTSLVQVGNNFYLNSNSSGSGPALKYGGAAVAPGQYGEWAPIGAEQTATGYQVAWKNTGADQYNIWTTDSSGNETSFTSVTSGSSTALRSAETSFQQDLNGDGVIGMSTASSTVIESSGSTSLVQVGNIFYLNSNSSVSGPALKYGGAVVVPGQYGEWAPIGAEQTATGYQVAWKNTGADQYNIWTTDNSGNETSFTPVTSGSSTALKSAETGFQQDLNGDGVIGIPESFAQSDTIGNAGSGDKLVWLSDVNGKPWVGGLDDAQADQLRSITTSVSDMTLPNVFLAEMQLSHLILP